MIFTVFEFWGRTPRLRKSIGIAVQRKETDVATPNPDFRTGHLYPDFRTGYVYSDFHSGFFPPDGVGFWKLTWDVLETQKHHFYFTMAQSISGFEIGKRKISDETGKKTGRWKKNWGKSRLRCFSRARSFMTSYVVRSQFYKTFIYLLDNFYIQNRNCKKAMFILF